MTLETEQDSADSGDTAGTHMVTNIPRATASTLASAVIRSFHGQHFDCADTIFVTDDDGRLEGIVRINDLFANSELPIGQIMEPEHESVRTDDDQEQIAVVAIERNMIVVPVVDQEQRLIGAVPSEALFRILRDEHMEDLQRLAGIAPHDDGPTVALRAPLFNRFRRRIPWLVFGLFASSIITLVMVEFEHSLAANVAVAFFVPALVYIAGAIGTQAVSVAVQGLSTENISITTLLHDELVIGIGIGASLGLISSALVFAAFGDSMLSLAVGLSVLSAGTFSALVGFGLPWVFDHFGFDPALGSGPICTILQDVSSLTIYFVLVGALVL
jgi:magnesium transporter